jgi:type II secretion system protein I
VSRVVSAPAPGNGRAARRGAGTARAGNRRAPGAEGFTLLEVLVALAILGFAVVAMMQLASRSLRLVKTSGDHQHAVALADRIAIQTAPTEEGTDSGQEGPYQWERSVTLAPVPDELEPKQTIPGKEPPRLFLVTIDVRWGGNQVVELATMRTPTTPPAVSPVQPGTTTGTQQTSTGIQQTVGGNTGRPSGRGGPQGGNPFSSGGRSR